MSREVEPTLHQALMQIQALTTGRDDAFAQQIQKLCVESLTQYSTAKSRDSIFRHAKRGTNYRVEGVVEIQASTSPLNEGDLAVIYRSVDTNHGYGRKLVEFNDGRFIRIAGRQNND